MASLTGTLVRQFCNFKLFQNEKVYSGVTVAQIVVLYFFENIKCALKIVPFSRKNSKMSQNVQKKLSKNRSEFFGLRRPNGEQKFAHLSFTNRYISKVLKKFRFFYLPATWVFKTEFFQVFS